MTLEDVRDGRMASRKKLSKCVAAMLRRAQVEKRLTCGLLPAIKQLEMEPERVLFCLLPQSVHGDSALHIHTVLLQAFCYEHDIHIIKVDSADKVGDFVCGMAGKTSKDPRMDCGCVLVHQAEGLVLSENERQLVDFCEHTLDVFPQPVIKLPAL